MRRLFFIAVSLSPFLHTSQNILLFNERSLFQLEPTIMPARQSRDLNLQDTYAAIENLLNRHGWRDGRECLLRTICELAETPFARTREDILEEVIHLILTPSEDSPGSANSTHRSVDQLYREAERLGRSGGDCVLAYPDCIESPLGTFTEIAFPQGTLRLNVGLH
ncbi:uncharacterized protein LOC108623014 [Ceratina calcarata]|uniref:Uncharacterized protein LOC108623014 n=1 Tax=Ceratina calcarata TaxID=156304 RepID=A0AAJ7W928_9HYME|nr:uncharacterized protein LOC108623014 [Ceratina calcarata]